MINDMKTKTINPTARKITKAGTKSKNAEWLVTIVKANGETQQRHIAAPQHRVEKEMTSKGYSSFFDVEKGRLSKFDLSTSVVPPVMVN